MTKSEIKDLDFHIKANLGFTVGNGNHWKERWEGDNLCFIEFSRIEYRDIYAHFSKMIWNDDGEGDLKVVTIESVNLGEWNNSDFANKAEAFANKCGF